MIAASSHELSRALGTERKVAGLRYMECLLTWVLLMTSSRQDNGQADRTWRDASWQRTSGCAGLRVPGLRSRKDRAAGSRAACVVDMGKEGSSRAEVDKRVDTSLEDRSKETEAEGLSSDKVASTAPEDMGQPSLTHSQTKLFQQPFRSTVAMSLGGSIFREKHSRFCFSRRCCRASE